MFSYYMPVNAHLISLVVSMPSIQGVYKTLNEEQWQTQKKEWGLGGNIRLRKIKEINKALQKKREKELKEEK